MVKSITIEHNMEINNNIDNLGFQKLIFKAKEYKVMLHSKNLKENYIDFQ